VSAGGVKKNFAKKCWERGNRRDQRIAQLAFWRARETSKKSWFWGPVGSKKKCFRGGEGHKGACPSPKQKERALLDLIYHKNLLIARG